jgi:hypothetical protein
MQSTNKWRRAGYILSFLTVAGVAARVSYSHIRDVALYGHQPTEVALILPLAVDGMMLIATLAMAEDKAANRHPRGWARFGFWFGAVISTVANVAATVVAHGWEPLAIGIAALAPVLLLLAIEIVAKPGKSKDEPKSAAAIPVADAQPPALPVVVAPAPVEATVEAAISVAELDSPDLPQAPTSPAVAPAPTAPSRKRRGSRDPYGPRDGDEYSERHDRRLRNGR